VRTAIAVLAKAPVPGHVKTRLCPPLRPEEAADLAAAAISDTLRAVDATRVVRKVLVVDGVAPPTPAGFRVVPQRAGDLAHRLAGAVTDVGGPVLVIGMDTPQVTSETLDRALDVLGRPDTDAVLGPALDGGYWAIGLTRPDPRVFDGVPMSVASTGAHQLTRMRELGLRVCMLPPLRDVDQFADAVVVAAEAPQTRFAAAFRQLEPVEARAS
jgi:uncharacterized protein